MPTASELENFKLNVIRGMAVLAGEAINRNMAPLAVIVADESDRPAILTAASPAGAVLTNDEVASILENLLESFRAGAIVRQEGRVPCQCDGCQRRRAAASN